MAEYSRVQADAWAARLAPNPYAGMGTGAEPLAKKAVVLDDYNLQRLGEALSELPADVRDFYFQLHRWDEGEENYVDSGEAIHVRHNGDDHYLTVLGE